MSLCLGFVSFWLINPLKSIFDEYLVLPLLSPFIAYPIEGYSFVLFVVLCVVITVFLIRKTVITGYILNDYILSFIFPFLILYLGDRIYWFNYVHLNLYYQIKVLDPFYFSLFLISIISFFNSIKWRFKKKPESWFELDVPKSKIEEDKLNRVNEVYNFINLINSLPRNVERSHVIGLVGSWGYGKTSFLSMIKEELEKNSIVIDFNPWITSSTSNLIEDFFTLLDNKISNYIQTNKSIYRYGKSLSNLTQQTNLIVELKSLVFPEIPLNDRIKLISELVTKVDKEVYCLVDDLDRLDSEEVFEVLRIVRNTANFPNFTFIMAYDKKYLIHSLKTRQIFNAEKYLDKIVQHEVVLPWISKFKLMGELVNLIQSKIEIAFKGDPNIQDALKKQVRELIFQNEMEKRSKYLFDKTIISALFLNIRDIVKFSNSFVYFLKNHYLKVYLPDLFFFELIKFIDISLISRLAANDYTNSVSREGITCYELHSDIEDDKGDFLLFSASTTIDKILNDNPNKEILKSLIEKCLLFPDDSDYNSVYGFCIVDNFEYYFSFYLNENQVSFDYIHSLINEDEV
jgi:hypothetical protein